MILSRHMITNSVSYPFVTEFISQNEEVKSITGEVEEISTFAMGFKTTTFPDGVGNYAKYSGVKVYGKKGDAKVKIEAKTDSLGRWYVIDLVVRKK